MNPKRLIIALVAAFITLNLTDYVIHQVWLKNMYIPDIGKLWRVDAEMKTHMGGILLGELLVATAFTMLWARIALGGAAIQCAIALGFFMGLSYSGSVVMQGAVQPLPDGLVTKWIIAGIAQSVLIGLVLFFVYKPTKPCPDISGK